MIHPARDMPFPALWDGLKKAAEQKLVFEQTLNGEGLSLFCYTKNAVFEKKWDAITLLSRGLIVDPREERVVATPFSKFFNVGETGETIPDLAFETFEKVDGSLIIVYWHDGYWRTATKGSFSSDQARWAAQHIAAYDLRCLDKGTTYLAEAVYPENRIVVHYTEAGLVLLAAYDGAGYEVPFDEIKCVGDRLGWHVANRHAYSSVSDLIAKAKLLPPSEEGFVLRFENGLRLKVKGDEYKRIHALISRCTPLAMWEAMAAGDDLNTLRRDLPEEFWGDFDAITGILNTQVQCLVQRASDAVETVAGLSDKEVGLRLGSFPEDVRRFIFPLRKFGSLLESRTREALFRSIRPTGNKLEGYVPSYAMNRVESNQEENV